MQLLRLQCARKRGFGNTVLQSKYNESVIHGRQVFREHSQQNLLSLKSNDSTTKRCKHRANLIKANYSEDSEFSPRALMSWHLLMSLKCYGLFGSFVLDVLYHPHLSLQRCFICCLIRPLNLWSQTFVYIVYELKVQWFFVPLVEKYDFIL